MLSPTRLALTPPHLIAMHACRGGGTGGQECGGALAPCCDGGACSSPGLTCGFADICVTCGSLGETACASDPPCDPGLTARGGICIEGLLPSGPSDGGDGGAPPDGGDGFTVTDGSTATVAVDEDSSVSDGSTDASKVEARLRGFE